MIVDGTIVYAYTPNTGTVFLAFLYQGYSYAMVFSGDLGNFVSEGSS